jgi:hypothetical protein
VTAGVMAAVTLLPPVPVCDDVTVRVPVCVCVRAADPVVEGVAVCVMVWEGV